MLPYNGTVQYKFICCLENFSFHGTVFNLLTILIFSLKIWIKVCNICLDQVLNSSDRIKLITVTLNRETEILLKPNLESAQTHSEVHCSKIIDKKFISLL